MEGELKDIFERLIERLDSFAEKNNATLERVCDKLDCLDSETGDTKKKGTSVGPSSKQRFGISPPGSPDKEVSFKKLSVEPPDAIGFGSSNLFTAKLQSEYRALADSYSRQKLPDHLKFLGSRAGIKANSCETANVISSGVKYTETILKILMYIDSHGRGAEFCINDQIGELPLCATAQLRFFQEEQNGLVMGNRFGGRVGQIFCDLRQHTATFTADAVEDAKSAIALAGAEEAARLPSRGGFSGYNRGNFRFRGCGRGRAGNQSQNNQYSQFTENLTPGYTARQVALDRQSTE